MRPPGYLHSVQDFIQHCREQGVPVTPQRIAIYECLVGNVEHPSAETIYQHLKSDIPSLSRNTVYTTLNKLESLGLIKPVNILYDEARYDPNIEPHHHLVCLSCQKIVDLPQDPSLFIDLPALYRQGFTIQEQNTYFKGCCPDCSKKQDPSSSSAKEIAEQ